MRKFITLLALFVLAISSVALGASTKESFIASCETVGGRDQDIYSKALVKNPDKYADQNVYVRGLVAKIEESDGFTAMYVYINPDYDVAVITYLGEVDVYDNDWVDTYGTVNGRIEGVNGLGVTTTWPHISAQFIDKVKR